MKNLTLTLFYIFISIGLCSGQGKGDGKEFAAIDFNGQWRFNLVDISEARNPEFNDQSWRLLNVPHDWSIEGKYDQNNPSGSFGGYMPGGVGWYRKTFKYDPSWKNKVVNIIFEGVYMNSTVWINGNELGTRPYGYSTFQYDISKFLKEGNNVIAVKVDNSKQPSGRWYTGCGIYRDVWLTVDNPVHIPEWGQYITTPAVSPELSEMKVVTDVVNTGNQSSEVVVMHELFDKVGKKVAGSQSVVSLKPGKATNDQTFKVNNVWLWSPRCPVLYTLKTSIIQNKKVLDVKTTQTAFRSLKFSAETGFWLNGIKTKFRGVCLHHDAGNLGAAVPDDVLYRRLKLLKDMGCNAIRTSHNPFAPGFYNMCDSMGFMVMNEAFDGWDTPKAAFDYGLYFREWWERDLRDFILRDRNHPCVVIWSIGNEVKGRTPEVERQLTSLVKSLDYRPVTIGGGHDAEIVDIAGFNGVGEQMGVLEATNKAHPQWPVIGTEVPHTWQTRGVYRTKTWIRGRDFVAPWAPTQIGKAIDTTKLYFISDLTKEEVFTNFDSNYLSSYDNAFVRISAREQWQRTDTMKFMMGEFRWTGIDYLGENIYPNRGWHCGVMDLCGFEKDHYFYYASQWTSVPMVHILPHWTHPGKEGVTIPVMVYSNCDEVELFLNNKSLGRQKTRKYWNLLWNVTYEPGILKAVGWKGGAEKAVAEFRTAGKPHAIKLLADKPGIGNSRDEVVHVTCTVVDENGVMVPYAANIVNFEMSGDGVMLTTENGDMMDHNPSYSAFRKTFNGMCLAYVRGNKGGKKPLVIKAFSEGLKDAVIEIKFRNK